MKLDWNEDKPVNGKCCIELEDEFGIYLAAFECSKGELVGQCSPDVPPYHWTGVVGIYCGPGETMEEAMLAAERSVERLLKWRKGYYGESRKMISIHMKRIDDKRTVMMEE